MSTPGGATDQVATEIATVIVDLMTNNKAAILADAGGILAREAIKLAWPCLVKEIPKVTDWAVQLMAQKLGAMTMNDALNLVNKIRTESTVKLY